MALFDIIFLLGDKYIMDYFTTKQGFFLYSSNIVEEELKKINSFLNLLDDSGVGDLITEWVKKDNPQGRDSYNPYNLFATIIYSFAFGKGTLRDIERSCKMGLDYIYIMENAQPTYVSIANYINNVFVPNIHTIMHCINIQIIKEMGIDIDDVFIDGSKFEANANKYKFVWKPRKNKRNLVEKIKNLVAEYGMMIDESVVTPYSVGTYIDRIKLIGESNHIEMSNFVTGKGHRLQKIQKDYLQLQKYLIKLLEYEEQYSICGERNSYYKTDHDATAMCLKSDYYSGLGSNMHAAYNVQYLVSKGIVLEVYVSQDRNDYMTLIPALEKFKQLYGFYPKNVCADSGYGSHTNYQYINKCSIGNYIKYPLWERERKGERPQLFFVKGDDVYCLNNKKGEATDTSRHPKSKEAKFYLFKGCTRCIYKEICKRSIKKKTGSTRLAEINKEYIREIEQVRANLLSKKGIEIRVNRSIQVEGDFGITKQNMSFERFRRRGMNKVLAEIGLVALGINIRKYLRFTETKTVPKFWIAPDNLEPESLPKIKAKKGAAKKS